MVTVSYFAGVREDRTPGGKHRQKRPRLDGGPSIPSPITALEADDHTLIEKVIDARPNLIPGTNGLFHSCRVTRGIDVSLVEIVENDWNCVFCNAATTYMRGVLIHVSLEKPFYVESWSELCQEQFVISSLLK